MKEIKFRAWDLDKKEMVYPPSEISSYLGPMMTWRGHCYIEGVYQNLDFQQFTGLIDKNGKEIYEADIISSCPGSGSADAGLDRLIVTWHEPSAGFFFDRPGFKNTTYVFRDEYLKTMEVIGNIYQNPSLLNHPHDK